MKKVHGSNFFYNFLSLEKDKIFNTLSNNFSAFMNKNNMGNPENLLIIIIRSVSFPTQTSNINNSKTNLYFLYCFRLKVTSVPQ